MAISVTKRSFIGKGAWWLQPRAGGVRRLIGNCSQATLSIAEQTIEQKDYISAGGGLRDSQSRIQSVRCELTCYDYSPENLALGLKGVVSDVAAGAVSDEEHTLYGNGTDAHLEPLDYLPDPDNTLTLTVDVADNSWAAATAYVVGDLIAEDVSGTVYLFKCTTAGTSDDPTEPTWTNVVGATYSDNTVVWTNIGVKTLVVDTHYVRTSSGIKTIGAATQFTVTGLPVLISYTKNAAKRIETLTDSGTEYEVFFEGLNEADDEAPMLQKLYRVKSIATDGLNQISEEYATMTIRFDVLKDETITGTGLSQYAKLDLAA